MCVVSMVAAEWDRHMNPGPYQLPPFYDPFKPLKPFTPEPILTPEQIAEMAEWSKTAIKPPEKKYPTIREVEAFIKLVKEAKLFDDITGQPDCENEEKFKILKELEELEERIQLLKDKAERL